MQDCSRIDLTADSRSRPAVKKPVPVAACIAGSDGIVQTREGPMRYAAGDAILTGSENERWPVGREAFLRTYAPLADEKREGAPPHTAPKGPERECAGPDEAVYVKKALVVHALQMTEDFFVRKEQGTLKGRPGDWLVQYAPGDLAVVSADIFARSYDLL